MAKKNKYARLVQSNKDHKRSADHFYGRVKRGATYYLQDAQYHEGVARMQKKYKGFSSKQEKRIIFDHSGSYSKY